MMNDVETLIKKANELQNQVVYHVISKAIMLSAKIDLMRYLCDSDEAGISSEELAKRIGFHPQPANRFFRLLETLKLVEITEKNCIKPTELTAHIKSIYSEHYFGSFLAFNYFEDALKNNKECWSTAFGQPFYESLKKSPDKLDHFQKYLEDTAESWLSFIPEVFNFSTYKKIVDVGGGQGQLLSKIIEANETVDDMEGVLFEREETILGALNYLKTKELLEKISLVKGNFLLDTLPDGDIYILCRILLNWEDDTAINIIKNCLKKIDKHQKLIIIDFVIPPKNHEHYQRAILHDLNLLAVFGGTIRSLADWEKLVKQSTNKQATFKIIDENISAVLNVPMIVIEI
ncbi:MAG: methyltransferase [Gammaproteobacteria bacterium]